MTKIKEEIRNIVGIEIKSDSIDDTVAVELENLFRSWVSKIESENFPIGERKWCKKCAKRITKYLLEEKQ